MVKRDRETRNPTDDPHATVMSSHPESLIKTLYVKIPNYFFHYTLHILMNIVDRLSGSEIRDIAFKTIGQMENSYWKELQMGKLTASRVGLAVRIFRNNRAKDNTELRARIHHPRSLDNIPAVRRGITN